jgi:hypothetical protein
MQATPVSTATTSLLRHVVLFAFNDSATPADIDQICAAFCALPSVIKTIVDIEWGFNNSPEHINDGFTHCFLLTFTSERDRDGYLVHPAHQAFVANMKPHLAKALVVDYWAARS